MPSTTPVQTIYMPTAQTLVVCDQNRPPPPFPTPPDPISNDMPPPILVQTGPAPTTMTSVATEAPVPLRPVDPVESPAMSPPVNSTFSPPSASPPREETCIRSLAWGGLKNFARVLITSGGDFGPLKSAIGLFVSFVEAHEAAGETRKEYKTLATELDGLFQDLAGAFASEESIPPGMRSSIMNLATSLDQEIAFLRQKETSL
ncbi:hypothetical protein FRC08_002915 [Ceratobasidium sp. 394]|nr:hypothetical protein FRC08_002915 [Ceratobasidium sp. 394]